jgi:probable rRNA maturation factor
MQIDLEVQRAVAVPGMPEDDQFRIWVEAALAGKNRDARLTIRIVDEHEAWQYNRDYRQRDYATNVLSFPAELPESLPAEIREPQIGDLLICAPVVTREAEEQQRPVVDHWAHLTIHGILHLLGYDHEISDEAVVMESMEKEILAGLGIPDPYIDIG